MTMINTKQGGGRRAASKAGKAGKAGKYLVPYRLVQPR